MQYMRVTQEQLEAIRQRAENATPGPWEIRWGEVVTKHPDHQNVSQWYDGYSNAICSLNDGEYIINSNKDNDAAFIAHARTDIPALLDHIAELEAELAYMNGVVGTLLSSLSLIEEQVEGNTLLLVQEAIKYAKEAQS
jgi:hypothetical protein